MQEEGGGPYSNLGNVKGAKKVLKPIAKAVQKGKTTYLLCCVQVVFDEKGCYEGPKVARYVDENVCPGTKPSHNYKNIDTKKYLRSPYGYI